MKKVFQKITRGCFFIRIVGDTQPQIDYCLKLTREVQGGGNAVSLQTGEVFWCSPSEICEIIPHHTFMKVLLEAYGESQKNTIAEIARRIPISRTEERRTAPRPGSDRRLTDAVQEMCDTDPERYPPAKMHQIFTGTPNTKLQ